MIRLDKREAREAARAIDELLLPLDDTVDFEDCVLMGVRGRVRSRQREVPGAVWPGLHRFLAESPGKLRSLVPYRSFDEEERRELIGALMLFHVFAITEGGVDGIDLLAAEGLLNALMAEPQKIGGSDLIDFVANVQAFAGDFDFDAPLPPAASSDSKGAGRGSIGPAHRAPISRPEARRSPASPGSSTRPSPGDSDDRFASLQRRPRRRPRDRWQADRALLAEFIRGWGGGTRLSARTDPADIARVESPRPTPAHSLPGQDCLPFASSQPTSPSGPFLAVPSSMRERMA